VDRARRDYVPHARSALHCRPVAVFYYLQALLKRWWALVGSAIFTTVGFWGNLHNKGDAWYVHVSIGAAILAFLIASFLAWKEAYDRAGLHEAPEIMLNYRRFYPDKVIVEEPLSVRNTGKCTASRIGVEIHDGSFRPLFEAIPYLAVGDNLALSQFAIVSNSRVGVTLPSSGRQFITYLRMLKPERDEQIVFRMVTLSYENEHGIRFAQDFRVSFNVVSEESKMFTWGERRKVKLKG
jgi:hypothetical protein